MNTGLKQTAAGMIGIVKNKAGVGSGVTTEQKTDPPVESFFAKQRKAMYKDPENSMYQSAKEIGKANASQFMDSVRNKGHKDHDKNVLSFSTRYDASANKVLEDFTNLACKDLNTGPYQMQDPNYENMLLSKYQPQGNPTVEQAHFYNIFKDEMQAKWNKSGYNGDADAVNNLVDKYGLVANGRTEQMRNFKPKP